MAPHVSVVIGLYNAQDFIAEAIDSVLAQSYQDFEIIVIDDSSRDDSVARVEAYDDPRIRLIRNERNLGIPASHNVSLRHAGGTYIARLDDDDICEPNRLAQQVAFMDAHPEVAACGSWAHVFGRYNGDRRPPAEHDDIRADLLFRNRMVHSTLFHRRAMLEADDIWYHDDMGVTDDYDIWERIARRHRVANLPEFLVRVRLHQKNTTLATEQDMIAKADRIRRRQLEALGLEVDDDTMSLHRRLSRREWPLSPAELEAAGGWLERILAANRSSGFYDRRALEARVSEEWWTTCYAHTAQGPHSWRTFRASPLSGLTPLTPLTQAKFALKSMFRR